MGCGSRGSALMHDTRTHSDSGDYTWDGTGPPPEPYGTGPSYAYTISGEIVTAVPCTPCTHIYDVATFPERLDADITALREELATLRSVVTEIVDALAELGIAVR